MSDTKYLQNKAPALRGKKTSWEIKGLFFKTLVFIKPCLLNFPDKPIKQNNKFQDKSTSPPPQDFSFIDCKEIKETKPLTKDSYIQSSLQEIDHLGKDLKDF